MAVRGRARRRARRRVVPGAADRAAHRAGERDLDHRVHVGGLERVGRDRVALAAGHAAGDAPAGEVARVRAHPARIALAAPGRTRRRGVRELLVLLVAWQLVQRVANPSPWQVVQPGAQAPAPSRAAPWHSRQEASPRFAVKAWNSGLCGSLNNAG